MRTQRSLGERCKVQGAMGSWETALCATCKGSKETTHTVGTETELGAIGVGVFLDKRLPVKELASALGVREYRPTSEKRGQQHLGSEFGVHTGERRPKHIV